MLPVSGAEQLKTSEANTIRPICSLRKAYSCKLKQLLSRHATIHKVAARDVVAFTNNITAHL